MLEYEFQHLVIKMAEIEGWSVYHVANVRGQLRCKSSVGFPDLLLVRNKIIAWECKIPPNPLSLPQKTWLGLFRSVGVEARMITPDDFDYIIETLCCSKVGEIRLGVVLEELKHDIKKTKKRYKRKAKK